MAVKCILTGQTPSVLDGVTENVQTQLNGKVDKVTGKGLSTNDYTSAEKTKLSGIETGAQKNTITGVKGSAETTYRTGNVNITATNIGLGNVDNTSDANKPISNATQAALNDKQSKITANGILKGNGTGGVSAAVKGTDYFTPADVNEIAAEAAKKVDISDKVSKSGDTMTGKLTVPQVETGADNSNFFQCRKFRGEGDANTYYHAIDFGYANHDKVDFHEYGGIWNFFKNTSGKANEGVLCGSITSNGWEGCAKLKNGSTMVTSQLTENSDAIATTAFVHGLVDNVKHYSASNPPPYPVTSVNGHTGAITVHEVPSVTTSDNGKFMRVVNGAWTATTAPNRFTFTATANQSTFTIPFDFEDSSALTVYYNGIMMKETDNYTVSGKDITLVGFTAKAGDYLTVMGIEGAAAIDYGKEAEEAIKQIQAVKTSAINEINTVKTDTINEINDVVAGLPQDLSSIMSTNKTNTMAANSKITMDSTYTPSANGDVATKKYVDDSKHSIVGTSTTYPIYIGSSTPASGTAPLLWIDTTASTGTFKYRTSTTGTWKTVPVAWS